MPTYEMPLLLRVMTKPETVSTLKRAAQTIFNQGGFIRQIDNLGKKPTAYKLENHGKKCTEAQMFIIQFDMPPTLMETVKDENDRDIDIIKSLIYKKSNPEEYICQLHEETLPAPYRKDVQQMVAQAKQRELRNNFKEKYFKNLKDYPFQT